MCNLMQVYGGVHVKAVTCAVHVKELDRQVLYYKEYPKPNGGGGPLFLMFVCLSNTPVFIFLLDFA